MISKKRSKIIATVTTKIESFKNLKQATLKSNNSDFIERNNNNDNKKQN